MIDIDDRLAIVWECYPNSFDLIYKNKSCSIYSVDSKYFESGKTNWKYEYVSEDIVPVIQEEKVDDLYEELKKEIEKKNIIVNYFQENEEYKEFIKGELKSRMIHFNLVEHFKNIDPRGKEYFQFILDDL